MKKPVKKTDLRPGLIAIQSSCLVALNEERLKAMQDDEKKKKTSPRSLQQEIELAVLKANRLGACGLKVTSIQFKDNSIELKADSFSQEDLNTLQQKRDLSLANHKRDLLEKMLQARFKKHSYIKVENLTSLEVDKLISEFESDPD